MTAAARWAAWLQTAQRLGLAPPVFWRLSLREFRALAEPSADAAPLARPQFQALAAAFPDECP
jgi:uncharacterized phage protein (TIGR02216 family)